MERFGSEETELIANGLSTKATRKLLPQHLHEKAMRRIDFVLRVREPQACVIFPGFKMLHGTLRGVYQFEISGAYRVRFQWGSDRAVKIAVGEFHDEDQ